MNQLLNIIHYILVIFLIIVLPFLSQKILKKTYIYFIPLIISFCWVIFDGCPLTNLSFNQKNASFIQQNLSLIFPNISVRTVTQAN